MFTQSLPLSAQSELVNEKFLTAANVTRPPLMTRIWSKCAFPDACFDGAVCCVSVDYLVRPVEVFREVARTLRPGGTFAVTFSNRLFPTKAIRGWLERDDAGRVELVERYFALAGLFDAPRSQLRTEPARGGDPLYAVWARTSSSLTV